MRGDHASNHNKHCFMVEESTGARLALHMVVTAPLQPRLLSAVTKWTCLNVFIAKLVADTPQKPARAHMARLIAQKMPKVYPAPAMQLAQCACADATLTSKGNRSQRYIGLQCRLRRQNGLNEAACLTV